MFRFADYSGSHGSYLICTCLPGSRAVHILSSGEVDDRVGHDSI